MLIMSDDSQSLRFRKLEDNEQRPYPLLLLADPSKEIIDEYLEASQVFVVEQNEKVIGTIVLQFLDDNDAEIKNVAVLPNFQRQGIGKYLIENIIEFGRQLNLKTIQIGTANSSIMQLNLYQKLGFEISEIKKNFFVEKYQEPIFENGIHAKHMIMLVKML
jgi:ribosomal protein S18 acetylase RimI-like enzyme